MAGYIRVDVEKQETQAINMKINSEIFEEFQKRCKERNLPMHVVLETFCRQYANGRYKLDRDDITKYKDNNSKTSVLNTPINKEVYNRFKDVVKAQGLFVRHVISAFIEDYGNTYPVMEFVGKDTVK